MKIALFLAAMISLTVIANLLLKQGSVIPAADRIFFGVFGRKSIARFLALGLSGLICGIVLRWLPLSVAVSIAAVQFVAFILASSIIFSEAIPPLRWLGIAIVAIGVFLVRLTTHGIGHANQVETGVSIDE